MIDVPSNVKNIFYNDNSKKRLVLSTNPNWIYNEDIAYQKDIDTLNLFNGNAYDNNAIWRSHWINSPFTDSDWIHLKIDRYSNMDSFDATDAVKTFAFKYRNYVSISMDIGIYPTNPAYPSQMRFGVIYTDHAGVEHEEDVIFNVADYLVNSEWGLAGRVSVIVPTYKMSAVGAHTIKRIIWRSIENNIDFYGDLVYGRPIISVSDDLDSFPIPYSRVNYSEIDLTEYIPFILLDNENIEYEKFKLTESLCSKDNIEFGLCEAANSSVTLINDTHNLKDEKLYLQTVVKTDDPENITYSALKRINWYKGTINNYDPSTHRWISWDNVTGYRFYTSAFGDVHIGDYYDEYFSQNNYVFVRFKFRIESFTTDGISPTYIRPDVSFLRDDGTSWWIRYGITTLRFEDLLSDDYTTILFRIKYPNNAGPIRAITRFGFTMYDENQQELTLTYSTKCWFTEFQVCSIKEYNENLLDFDINNCYVYKNTIDQYLADHREYSIPLGIFNVNEINNDISYDLVRKTLTMYDNMIALEQNAANWYTHYMYGISTNEASPYGYEFARQIYSSYYNYMKTIGVVSEPTDMERILTKTYSELESTMSTKSVSFLKLYFEETKELHNTGILYYAYVDIANPNPQKLYSVKWFNYNYQSEVYVPWYSMHDKYNRGLENANILVEERLSDGSYNKFLADPDDLFALSPTCTQLRLYVPMYAKYTSFADKYIILDHIEVYMTDKTFDLENASARLLYYDYNLKETEFEKADEDWPGNVIDRCIPHIIFECDSNITGRDVVHSLLELTGCFFRMSRKTGEPEFIYCTKSGLYPSNTLYPADDLYPRRGTDQVASPGTYISTEYADYTVTRFGKIQILKNQTSNEAESNVQWQYAGNTDAGLNTYIISDNIFYCNKDMTYNTEHMQELDKVLEKMYYRISNMDYVPNTTEALGMPWVECGDRVGLLTAIGGFETFIYRRTLKGIQGLFDIYESRGDEYNNAISNYGY